MTPNLDQFSRRFNVLSQFTGRSRAGAETHTVLTRQAKLDPIHAAALVATGSLVIWLPIYLATSPTHLVLMPVADLAVQAVFQGIVVTIVSLVLYVRSVAILGASGGAAFGALVPALTAFIAIPLLGEWPSDIGWVAIALISAGVYLTSGGPWPSKRPTSHRAGTP